MNQGYTLAGAHTGCNPTVRMQRLGEGHGEEVGKQPLKA